MSNPIYSQDNEGSWMQEQMELEEQEYLLTEMENGQNSISIHQGQEGIRAGHENIDQPPF